MKRLVNGALATCGLTLQRVTSVDDRLRERQWHDLLVALDVVTSLQAPDIERYREFCEYADEHRQSTFAQNFQDIFVLWTLDALRGGTFVEFGADDGVKGSNTLLLERDYGWTGLLLEPNRTVHGALASNRHCRIDHRAVSRTSGQSLPFTESEHRQLSHLAGNDVRADEPPPLDSYEVTTVTLDDVLMEYRIPPGFQLLSIDVEGAELDVLAGFTVAAWRPRVVVIEHNARARDYEWIELFFQKAGYTKCLPGFSRNDLWFVHSAT